MKGSELNLQALTRGKNNFYLSGLLLINKIAFFFFAEVYKRKREREREKERDRQI